MRCEAENLSTEASENLESVRVLLEGQRFYASDLLAIPGSGVELFCYTSEEFERGREGLGLLGTAVKVGVEFMPAENGEG